MICPICSKDSDRKYRPFCSKHCADVDLGRWLTNSYTIAEGDTQDVEHPPAPEQKKDRPQH